MLYEVEREDLQFGIGHYTKQIVKDHLEKICWVSIILCCVSIIFVLCQLLFLCCVSIVLPTVPALWKGSYWRPEWIW